MTKPETRSHRQLLQEIARRNMIERGLEPDFSTAALAELGQITGPASSEGPGTRDYRDLLWCSIDNDDSRDLDQLTVADEGAGGACRILVAIADVAALVKAGSALDAHARHNTTSVYTVGAIYPMLPERLSTDLTSLGFDADRLALVVEMTFTPEGILSGATHGSGWVRNRAKLAYNSVADWLEGSGPAPDAVTRVHGLAENLRAQDRVAQKLKAKRHEQGALELETIESRPVFKGQTLTDLVAQRPNRAKTIIEDFMIAANSATARFLASRNRSSLRRVVRTPKYWGRIVAVAAEQGTRLPNDPDSAALERFLIAARAANPATFPDLSLTVIKLLGAGEYVLERPGGVVPGHFGLAIKDYAHATAPNRRYPDLLTHRLVKAALIDQPAPYSDEELTALALHCTEQEDAAKKVERQVTKCAAALLLQTQIGRIFDGIITGASVKGTFVRITHPPSEGLVVAGGAALEVGDRVRVKLRAVDLNRCYIDFEAVR